MLCIINVTANYAIRFAAICWMYLRLKSHICCVKNLNTDIKRHNQDLAANIAHTAKKNKIADNYGLQHTNTHTALKAMHLI